MGLLFDFKPDDMMDMEQDLDDPALEAEFAAIVGKKPNVAPGGKRLVKVGIVICRSYCFIEIHIINADRVCCSQTLKGRIWNTSTNAFFNVHLMHAVVVPRSVTWRELSLSIPIHFRAVAQLMRNSFEVHDLKLDLVHFFGAY